MRRTCLALLVLAASALPARAADAPPAVGDKAADFSLPSVDGETIALHDLTAKGPVVLVVLRGYPGYQCPLCTRQVGEFIGKAKAFDDAGARVVMVYPGPAEQLKARAGEFLDGTKLPESFDLVLDPDYALTDADHLRWDAPR